MLTVLSLVLGASHGDHGTISLLPRRIHDEPPNLNVLSLQSDAIGGAPHEGNPRRPPPRSPPNPPPDHPSHRRPLAFISNEGPEPSSPGTSRAHASQRPRRVAIRWIRILGENAAGRVRYQLATTTWDARRQRLPPEPSAETPTRLLPEATHQRAGRGRRAEPSDERAWAPWRLPAHATRWWRLSAPAGLAGPRVPGRAPGGLAPAGTRHLLDAQIYEVLFHLPLEGRPVLTDGERARLEAYLHALRLPAEPCPPRVRQRWRELRARTDPTRPVPVEGPGRTAERAGGVGTERLLDTGTSSKESGVGQPDGGAGASRGRPVSRSEESRAD